LKWLFAGVFHLETNQYVDLLLCFLSSVCSSAATDDYSALGPSETSQEQKAMFKQYGFNLKKSSLESSQPTPSKTISSAARTEGSLLGKVIDNIDN
jgi:hypothetical protein